MKPLVAVDLDGVVVNFVAAYDRWVEHHAGHEPLTAGRWDWYIDYPDGGALWAEFWRRDRHHAEQAFTEARPVPYALNALHALEPVARITFVTHRPAWLEPVTRAWLDDHDLPHPLVHATDKADHPGDLHVDDHPATVAALLDAGLNAWCFDTPWNRDHVDLPRVHGWPEVLARVADVMEDR